MPDMRPVEPIKTAEDKYHPRSLPSYREDDNKVFYREGVGLFHVQGVGSTARGYGVHIKFHAEGERESRNGHVAFQLRITEDLKIEWYGKAAFSHLGWEKPIFSEAEIAVMQDIMDNFHTTNEMDFWWDINDELDQAITDYDRKIADWKRSIEHFNQLLSSPLNPKTKYDSTLPDPEGRQEYRHVEGKGMVYGPKMGAQRPSTAEERAEMRRWWTTQLIKTIDAVNAHDPEPVRIQRIRIARQVTRWWSRAQRSTDAFGWGPFYKQKGSRLRGILRCLVEQAFAGTFHIEEFESEDTFQKKKDGKLVKPPVEGNTLFIIGAGCDLWCDDKGEYDDGSRRVWVINGCYLCKIYPDGRFGSLESEVYVRGAKIAWEGQVPKEHGGGADPDYDRAMNWIRENHIPA